MSNRVKKTVEEKLSSINSTLGTSYQTFEEVIEMGDSARVIPLAYGDKIVSMAKELSPTRELPVGIHSPLHTDGGIHSHPFLGAHNSGEHKFHRRLILGYRRSLHRHPESIMPGNVPELIPHGHALIPPTYFGFHIHPDLTVARLRRRR